MIRDERPFVRVLPFDSASNENAFAATFLNAAADVDDLARPVLEHFGGCKRPPWPALEEEQFARPGAGEKVHVTVAVEVHNMWTESDASATRHSAVFAPFLELHARRELGLSVRALVSEDP